MATRRKFIVDNAAVSTPTDENVVDIQRAQWLKEARSLIEPNVEDEEWGFDSDEPGSQQDASLGEPNG